MNPILIIILKDTYTLTVLKHKLNILKSNLSQNFFGTKNQPTMDAKDLIWLKSLSPDFFQNFTKNNIYNLFSQLEKEISALKVLTIYLTFDPDDSSLIQIGTFARRTFSNLLLLDIKYDPNLIAGTALVWNGVHKDYSLRSTIEQKKDLILESFKKYLRGSDS